MFGFVTIFTGASLCACLGMRGELQAYNKRKKKHAQETFVNIPV